MPENDTSAWICRICGYIHRGPKPPKECPVCGATSDMFDPYQEVTPEPEKETINRWRCLSCSYVHYGETQPDVCPVCGAVRDYIEPVGGPAEKIDRIAVKEKIVIVGAGIAGISAAEAARKVSRDNEITVISKERELPYFRLNLTRYLAGEITKDQLPIHLENWYKSNNIDLLQSQEASFIDTEKSCIRLKNDDTIPFTKLILATGAHPFIPPIPGSYKEGIRSIRTLEDADNIINTVKPGMNCVLIGGGILGLEAATGLVSRGADVTVLEGFDWILPRQLNKKGSDIFRGYVEGIGIKLLAGAKVMRLEGDEYVRSIRLNNDINIPSDLVLVTAGIRANSFLARQSGLDVNRGIVVNNHLYTSHPDILAAGDVAEHHGNLYGLWAPSLYQGTIAGQNVAGSNLEFGGIPSSNTLKVLKVNLFSIGIIHPQDASFQVYDKETESGYFCFIFQDNYLVGAILLGDTSLSSAVKKIVETRQNVAALLSRNPEVEDIIDYLVPGSGDVPDQGHAMNPL